MTQKPKVSWICIHNMRMRYTKVQPPNETKLNQPLWRRHKTFFTTSKKEKKKCWWWNVAFFAFHKFVSVVDMSTTSLFTGRLWTHISCMPAWRLTLAIITSTSGWSSTGSWLMWTTSCDANREKLSARRSLNENMKIVLNIIQMHYFAHRTSLRTYNDTQPYGCHASSINIYLTLDTRHVWRWWIQRIQKIV